MDNGATIKVTLCNESVCRLVQAAVDENPAYDEYTVRKFVCLGMERLLDTLQANVPDSKDFGQAWHFYWAQHDNGMS